MCYRIRPTLFITIEDAYGAEAIENLMQMQAGDVSIAYANVDNFVVEADFNPSINLEGGIDRFYVQFS